MPTTSLHEVLLRAVLLREIEGLRDEKGAMLKAADLSPREDGNSIYSQLARAADLKIIALKSLLK